jgi:hypothetical protein
MPRKQGMERKDLLAANGENLQSSRGSSGHVRQQERQSLGGWQPRKHERVDLFALRSVYP